MNKYLILGIGNIGPEFENTRHNIGFDTIDKIETELKIHKLKKITDEKRIKSALITVN